ncbi:MAG: TonB-dependent receptor [Bacteroidota bacterium]
MKNIAYSMLLGLILMGNSLSAQFTLSGKIVDKLEKKPLPGAHLSLGSTQSVFSDETGRFNISHLKKGEVIITVSYVGFSTEKFLIDIHRDTTVNFELDGAILMGDEVNIIATRAHDKYPTAYSSITKKELSVANLGRDIPFLLLETPSTVATSDAGNGVGYSGISIRGTDLTRINVTINGIPLNDAESQGVWFVDLPDMASSAENIQIQRGVGTSTNGAGAFGASIHFLTSGLHQDPYGELNISGGSFNTFKTTLSFGTGLMANKFSVDGRLSYIHSDGYIERAFSNLKSYYLSGGYYGKNTTFRIITFSGHERTYQAWEGVPKDSLATNRTYNPAGEYINKTGSITYYNNQTDNYRQAHYQMIFSQAIVKNWNINAAIHYTKGKGYYENYKQGASFSDYGLNDVIIGDDTLTGTDLINRKMMDNDFCGVTLSSNISITDLLKITLGGSWNRYSGRHFGKVIWAEYASNGDNDRNWYSNTGLKKDFNIYLKLNYQIIKKLSLFADLQYRNVNYKMEGTLDDLRTLDQQHVFNFFNPKGGLFFEINKKNDLYFSFGAANREPSRNNYKDADPGRMPVHETLWDYELGYKLKLSNFSAGANLYFMDYYNQLVLTGEINNVGEAIMVNVPRSYRAGIELSTGISLFQKKLQWSVNVTFSSNKIKNFKEYIDMYDAEWNPLGQDTIYLGETDLSFSPNVIFGSVITYNPVPQITLSLNSKYIGPQFIDNTSTPSRSLHGYFVNGATAAYVLKTKLFKEIGFNVTVNNLFNQKYESNAWVYPCYIGGQYQELNGYFPQALINFLVGISVKI